MFVGASFPHDGELRLYQRETIKDKTYVAANRKWRHLSAISRRRGRAGRTRAPETTRIRLSLREASRDTD